VQQLAHVLEVQAVVGSSSRYSVRPVSRLASSRDSLMRWASPPDSVVADWPSAM
jgi:hypothetical protein